MKSPNYERSNYGPGEQGDEYNEKRLKQYLERINKQWEIYENEIVAEKSMLEIIAGKHRIKRDAKIREEYKETKHHSDVPSNSNMTNGSSVKEKMNNSSNSNTTNGSCVKETTDNSHGTATKNYTSGSAAEQTHSITTSRKEGRMTGFMQEEPRQLMLDSRKQVGEDGQEVTDSEISQLYDGDRINDLPQDLLHCILRRLSVDDAAKTTVLSKEWRHIWAMNTHLILDEFFYEFFFTRLTSNNTNKRHTNLLFQELLK